VKARPSRRATILLVDASLVGSLPPSLDELRRTSRL